MAASEKREVPTIDPEVEPEFVGVHSALSAKQCQNYRGEHVEDVERCEAKATHTMVIFDGNGVKEIASCDECGEPDEVGLEREWSGELVD